MKSVSNEKVLSQIALHNVLDELSILDNEKDIEEAIANEVEYTVDDALFFSYMRVNSKNELLTFTAFISNSPLNKLSKNKS